MWPLHLLPNWRLYCYPVISILVPFVADQQSCCDSVTDYHQREYWPGPEESNDTARDTTFQSTTTFSHGG